MVWATWCEAVSGLTCLPQQHNFYRQPSSSADFEHLAVLVEAGLRTALTSQSQLLA